MFANLPLAAYGVTVLALPLNVTCVSITIESTNPIPELLALV